MAGSSGYRAIGLLDFDNDAASLPDMLFMRRDPGTGDYGLYVATNAVAGFNSPALWYQDAALPKVIGLEEDGLTYLANDTSELMQWAGVANTYYTRKQFSDFLAAKDLNLAQGSTLDDPNRKLEQDDCQINYGPPTLDADTNEIFDVPFQANARVEYGFLTCNVQLNDRLSMQMQVLYGGCEASGGLLGASASCEVGTFATTLEADLTPPPPLDIPTSADVTVKGPNAAAGASFGFSPNGIMRGEPAGFSAGAGAELISTSASAEVAGVGAGGKLAIGVGAGADMGIKDGVISGEIKLAFLVGASIEFSVDVDEVAGNVESTARGFYKVGKTTYTFAGDAADAYSDFVVFTAGPEVYDAASKIGGAVEDEAGKAGKVALTQAGQAVYFFAGEDGRRSFFIFVDSAGRTIAAIFTGLENAATDVAEGAVGVIVDIGGGIADGAAYIWDLF